MGGGGNDAVEEDWHWDLNPRVAAMGSKVLAEKNHGLLFLFLRYSILDWAKGGRKDCEFVGIPKDFGISMKTLSHYS